MPPRDPNPSARDVLSGQSLTASASSDASPPATTGETVTVACKLPNGLRLRTFSMVEGTEPVLGGGSRTVRIARPDPQSFTIKGNVLPFGRTPEHAIRGGFALTSGIPRDFWERWLEQNAESDLVRNGLIFAAGASHAEGEAAERRDLRSGLEPIDPLSPPTGFGRVQKAEV